MAANLPALDRSIPSSPVLEFETETIGRSLEGRPLTAYRFGDGGTNVLLIGGIHGGSEWNTIVLVRELIDYFYINRSSVPSDITLHLVPNMNPDGLHRVTGGAPLTGFNFYGLDTGAGRFNGRFVDLNRNWDNNWQPVSNWRYGEVDAGTAPFSEPETRAVRDYIERYAPALTVFYHCAANGIWYGGSRAVGTPAETFAVLYSEASGYPVPRYDGSAGNSGAVSGNSGSTGTGSIPRRGGGLVNYRITGAATGYLISRDFSSITVELETAYSSEFERNLQAVLSVLESLE